MFKSLFKKETKVERNLQLEFNEILKGLVFPFFKELGFKKNGNGFKKKINELTQVANIQRSKWNNQDSVSFTLNIGFFVEEIFTEDWNKEIPKFIREYDCQIYFRLGQVVKGNDYWYELNNNTEKVNLEIEISKHLQDCLKPILETNTDLNSLKQLILDDEKIESSTADIYKIKIFLKVGETQKAKELLNKAYFNALNPDDCVSKTVYPDGTELIKTTKSKINTDYIERLKKIGKDNNIILN